ncbi:MAG: helix-turn-helix domain-containing protein [Proteobacteria bacterium]|nr:helix-turn-helix domain-containing protein [Pseudomonadota bacterium]
MRSGVNLRETACMEALQAQCSEPPLAYSVVESCRLLSISRRHFYGLLAEGKIRTVKLGARRVVPRAEVERLANEGA